MNPLSWALLLARALSWGALPSRSLMSKICSPKVQGCDPALCLAPFSQATELHHRVVTVATAAPHLQVPSQFFLSRKREVQQRPPSAPQGQGCSLPGSR